MTRSTVKLREAILPQSLPPRGLRRVEAAAYVGVSPSLFDWMVAEGIMPRPKRIRARTIWDKREIDEAFDCLADEERAKPARTNPWDAVSNV